MIGTQQHLTALPPARLPGRPGYRFRLSKEAFTSYREGRARLDAYYARQAAPSKPVSTLTAFSPRASTA